MDVLLTLLPSGSCISECCLEVVGFVVLPSSDSLTLLPLRLDVAETESESDDSFRLSGLTETADRIG